METKKNPQANLEKFKFGFLLTGLMVTIGLTLAAFNWANESKEAGDTGMEAVIIEDEMIEITRQELEPPKPEIQQQPVVTDVIEIVKDETVIEDDYEFDLEADEDTEIEVDTEEEEEEDAPTVFVVVEKMPEYPGGITALRKHIGENTNYPAVARENDIQGTVYVKFVVTNKGKVDQVQIARGVDPLLDEEAIRVVKTLAAFTPGQQGGKNVSVWYSVPIVFKLN